MFRRLGLLLIVCLLLGLTSLAGCGTNETNGTAVPSTVTTASSPPASTGTAVPPTVTMASSPPASTGSVTLRTDAPTYRTGDAISVTLSNQSLQTILFPDHLTNCTVVLLQRQVNESWESNNVCKLMIVTRMHSLDAGNSLTVRLGSTVQWNRKVAGAKCQLLAAILLPLLFCEEILPVILALACFVRCCRATNQGRQLVPDAYFLYGFYVTS
jgi:hypothetical protein